MIVYKATIRENGKIYIGKTSYSLPERVSRHITANYTFSKALKKYGLESFEFAIIDNSDSDEELSNKEIYWIKFYKSKGKNGYNMTDGGEGIPGWHHSIEARKKMSEARRGVPSSEETKKLLSKVHTGVPLSEEHRRNIGLAHIGRKHTKESRMKMSLSQKGSKKKPLSEETKIRMSIVRKGIKLAPRTAEHNRNQSIAMKKYWQNKNKEVAYVT